MTIHNYYPPMLGKYIVLSQSTYFGVNSLFISISYLTCGAICFFILTGFIA